MQETKRVCPSCGREEKRTLIRFCRDCGLEYEVVPMSYIRSKCKICTRPILTNPNADMHLCNYHWEIYDANEGWN